MVNNNLTTSNQNSWLHGFKKYYIYFYIFLLIYIEFGYTMVVAGVLTGRIRLLILLIASIPLLLSIKKINISSIALLGYLVILVLLNMLRDASADNGLILLVPICLGFIVASSVNFREVCKVFTNIVLFLAVFSLITFAITLLYPRLVQNFPLLGHLEGSTARVHDAFFSVSVINTKRIRNFGIAWEPGAFAILLSIALFWLLFYEKKVGFTKIAVLIVTMITTFSTMGYFVMVGLLLAASAQKAKSVKLRRVIFGAIIVLLIVILMLPGSTKDLVFSKLSGLFSNGKDVSDTTQARLDAVTYPFLAFLSSPLFGVGYDRFAIINETLCNSVATNTIINWYATMGLLLGLPCTHYYIKFIVKNGRALRLPLFMTILMLIIAVLMVSTESLLRISLIYIIIFYATQKDFLKDYATERQEI